MVFSTWRRRLAPRAQAERRVNAPFVSCRARRRTAALVAELLEDRIALSGAGSAQPIDIRAPLSPDLSPAAGPLMFKGAFTPAGIQKAYGIDQLIANGNDGTGQTIALIDAFDDPAFSSSGTPGFATSDLHFFDQQFGLPDPVFLKVAEDGSTNYPSVDPNFPPDDWEGETALDVEWAHAIAPAARILLVECDSDSNDDLFAGLKWAATPVAKGGGGATVVSMSFGTAGGDPTATSLDANFSPAAFPGVTFVAAAGDNGSVRNQGDYPADSPDIVAVGGTRLTVNASGVYSGETVWRTGPGNATGGGTSRYENQPIYQKLAEPTLTKRTTPDVAFDADPGSGVVVYDSYNGGGGDGSSINIAGIGGTSVSAPCWAGLIAIADQIRASQPIPEAPLTGATQTLPILYSIYSSPSYHQDFHDITSGGNGTFSATAGYDEVTGIGTPIANTLVPDLANVTQLVYMAPSGTNNFLLQVNGADLDLFDNGLLVASNPVAQTTSALIAGARDNSLTVDATAMPAKLAVTFDGGPGNQLHTLTLKNGSFTNETYTYAGASSGAISLDGLTLSFADVTTTANTTTGANLIFDLPAGAQATLAASGSPNNALSGTGLVTSGFGNAFGIVTVNAGGGSSLVQLSPLDPSFAPTAETFSGQAGDTFRLSTAATLGNTTAVTVSTAALDLNGFSPTIGALAGNGTITDDSSLASTLTVGAGDSSGSFSGAIGNGAGTVALTKAGNGTQTLAGASTYTGATTVAGGTLEIDGSIASNVTVQSGATLDGAGATGAVTVQSGAALYPGINVFALSSGSLNLAAGATFNVALNGTGNSSQESVTSGTVTLGGANLVFSGGLVPVLGQFFTIINNTGNLPVNGTFNGLPDGAVIPNFLGSGLNATLSYGGGDGNDVVLFIGQGALSATTLTASTGATTYGQSVTFTATVTAKGNTPTGNVEFFDKTSGADLGAGTLVSSGGGTATWTYTTTATQLQATGTQADDIRAVFSSKDNFLPSGGILAGGLTVAPVTVSVMGVTANNKVYDHTSAVVLGTTSTALLGVLSGDTVTLNAASASGTFASADVGSNIAVTISGLTLSGPQARDYMLVQPSTTGNITPAPLTVTGITANNKTYNATTAATLSTASAALTGIFNGDAVTLNTSAATGNFVTKDAGTNVTVNISGLILSGPQARDYALTQPTTTANITPAPLTVTGITANKVYDASTRAILNTAAASLAGVFAGDTVTLSAANLTATFASKNVGSNMPVTGTALGLAGPQAADYTLAQPSLTANITPAPLTVTGITANNKVYDATTAATLGVANATLVGVLVGDAVTIVTSAALGTFASKDVGVNIPVAVSGLTIGGSQAANYTLTQPATVGNITPFALTVAGVTANNKVYDSTTVATLNTANAALVGAFNGDVVILSTSGAAGVWASKNVGNGITVAVSGLTIGGAQADDYLLVQATTTANITAAPVTVTGITANDKTYDASTTALLNTDKASITGLFPSDNVTLKGATGVFASPEVGSNIPITAITLAGPQAGDYTVALNQSALSASITPAPLTVTGIAADKVYDGTTTVTLNPANASLVGVFGNDAVTLVAVGATGSFASKDAGNGVPVTLTGLALIGTKASDYTLAQPAPTTANITPAPLTVTGITANKVYDAATHATPDASQAVLGGVFSGDSVTLVSSAMTGRFASKDVGNSILVLLSGLTLGGPQAGDYALKQPLTTKANIAPAPLTVTGITADKVYDGTTFATLNTASATLVGAYAGDAVMLNAAGATGTFASKDVGNNITVKISGLTLGGTKARDYSLQQPVITANITPAASAATYFAVTAPASAVVGSPINFTVTARDQLNNPAGTGYTGMVHFTSTDPLAVLPGDVTLTNGSGVFTATLGTPGTQTIGASDTVNIGIAGVSNLIGVNAPATQFAVSAPATATAGGAFPVTVTAEDSGGHIATGYTGTVHLTSTDGQALPAVATLTNGVGIFMVTLNTAAGGPWTVSAQDTLNSALIGTSGNITVSPAAAAYFTLAIPPTTIITGTPFNVTVTAHDRYGNIATGYTGHVHFASSDNAANLPVDSTLSNGTGSFSTVFNTAGSQTITVTDTSATNPIVMGTSGSLTTRGLIVTSFTPMPTGFTVTFSKPFVPGNVSLYGTSTSTVQDVTLVGDHVGAISGSLVMDASNTSMTFKATANSLLLMNGYASPVLPDDTYTATIVSGGSTSSGFSDVLGIGLDGLNNATSANYVSAPFTTHYEADHIPVLSMPDFARGPNPSQDIKVPNNTGAGIPITLYSAAGVTDVTFTLSYNPALITVSGALTGNATDPASSFTLVNSPTIADATHATASFHFQDATPQSGVVVLGDITAIVPATAAGDYKAKELLQLSAITINHGAVPGAVSANGVHVNAYFGDVTGNGTIDALDVATASNVAQGKDTGLAAYPLLDPAIVGDVAADFSIDAGDSSTLAAFVSRLPSAQIPAIPSGLTITPGGPDPTLSLGGAQRQGDKEKGRQGDTSASPGLVVTVPVMLDDPHPAGSTGMTEAILALTFDPSVSSVASVTLGSLQGLGTGWQLSTAVDQATGQIAITLYSLTPLTESQAGSLVNITFNVLATASDRAATVRLVNSVVVNGQDYVTQIDDAQGQLVLALGADHQTITSGGRVSGRLAPGRRSWPHAG
jgi:autotransporter-associated beta strand protein